jgi:hypothetical protein
MFKEVGGGSIVHESFDWTVPDNLKVVRALNGTIMDNKTKIFQLPLAVSFNSATY